MITAQDLERCVDILAEINANADTRTKRLCLEMGYIIKQELEIVKAWDASQRKDRNRGYGDIDVRKLLEDNSQLFNENKQLQDLNIKLKEIIDQRIPSIENGIKEVNNKFNIMNENINKL